jgi:hypothetical protein
MQGSMIVQFFILYMYFIKIWWLSDVKEALDDMNVINQHSVHVHLFGL